MGTFTFRDLIKTNDLLSLGLQLQTKDDLIYRAMLCGLVEGRVEGPPCSDLCFLSPTPSCIAITLPYHVRHSHLPCCCCADLIVEFWSTLRWWKGWRANRMCSMWRAFLNLYSPQKLFSWWSCLSPENGIPPTPSSWTIMTRLLIKAAAGHNNTHSRWLAGQG